MTVTIYRSTDASAPTLTGQVGSLIALLDACLVTGYGSKSAAGWTKPFSNSGNQGCWRNSPTNGTGYHLNILDSGPGGGGAREARMTGFATMSALGTGTGQFPTSGQLAIGIGAAVIRKSVSADATARPWVLVADDTVFYLNIDTGDFSSPVAASMVMFGDFVSYKASDPYRCAMIGRQAENTADVRYDPFHAYPGMNVGLYSVLAANIPGHFIAANWNGVGGSITCGKHSDMVKMGAGSGAAGSGLTGQSQLNSASINATVCMGATIGNPAAFPYPNGPDGGAYLAPVWLHHNGCVRGHYKGLWNSCHDRVFNHLDTFSGSGQLAGKDFIALNIIATNGNGTPSWGQAVVETSDTWS